MNELNYSLIRRKRDQTYIPCLGLSLRGYELLLKNQHSDGALDRPEPLLRSNTLSRVKSCPPGCRGHTQTPDASYQHAFYIRRDRLEYACQVIETA